ncbi:hypothetical protein [Chryseobacterium sp. YIM B08800]|uniref:hypothetical protein n=1 Tax=Chryseobacterium sp. YIM B08800 TaxID=2984136 RepID=UPI00223E9329|nr:hypothetical protein [Chryseobacterium sp. YIM B08800]
MEDIKNEKFEIDNYFDFTIMDEYANRWDGDFEPSEVTIAIGSNSNSCSIAEVNVKEFENLEKWKIIQVADNCTEIEVKGFIEEKHDELKLLLSEKLDDPDSNGQC